MRTAFGPLCTEIPDDLRDETPYAFRDAEAEEAIEVVFERHPAPATPGTVLAARIDNLARVYEDLIAFEPVLPLATRAGPAVQFSASVREPGPVTTHAACVMLGDVAGLRSFAFVLWTGPRARRDLFERIAGSMAITDRIDPPSPGVVRRAAGPLTLDVPTSYAPPRAFRFSGGTIVLEAFVEDALRSAAPSADEVAYLDNGRLDLTQSDGPTDVTVAGARGHESSWVFVHTGDGGAVVERYCVRQLVVDFGGVFVRIRARTASTDWRRLTDAWRMLLAQASPSGGG